MSTEKIDDRPYPFEVKTRILQLVGLALGTPKDVADIHVNIQPAWTLMDLSVHVGGYDSKRTDPNSFNESIYLNHHTIPEMVKKLDDLIAKTNAATANGRRVKAKRLRDEAAALLDKAREIEAKADGEDPGEPEELCSGSTQTSETQ